MCGNARNTSYLGDIHGRHDGCCSNAYASDNSGGVETAQISVAQSLAQYTRDIHDSEHLKS